MKYPRSITAVRYRVASYRYVDADPTSIKLYRLWRWRHTRTNPLVGFMHLRARTPCATWQLDNLWVLPMCRGYGLGTDLLHAAIRHVQRNGTHALTVALASDDLAASPFLPAWLMRVGFVQMPTMGSTTLLQMTLAVSVDT